MSRNILEKILKLSYSQKKYLNDNFNDIFSIIGIKTAQNQEPPSNGSNAISKIIEILKDPSINIEIGTDLIPLGDAISFYNENKDQDILEEIYNGINNIIESSYPELYDEVVYLDASNLPLESLNITPTENPVVETSDLEKEFQQSTEQSSLKDKIRSQFKPEAGVDVTPIDAIVDFMIKESSEDLDNSDRANLKIISRFNDILRTKYLEYQDKKDEKSLMYYRDLEKSFPEILLRNYISIKENKDLENVDINSIENPLYKTWIEAIRSYNEQYQTQMDAALLQRSSVQEFGERERIGYDKAALFCNKCNRFFMGTDISGGVGGVHVNENFKNQICRKEENGGSVTTNPQTGQLEAKEGCEIVKNLLSGRKRYSGGVADLLAADKPLSLDLGEEFFGIKTDNFKFFGEEEGRGKKKKDEENQDVEGGDLFVTSGHFNNINESIKNFLREAKELEKQTGFPIFGSSGDQSQYYKNINDFVRDTRSLIETSTYFMPGFFSPDFGYKNQQFLDVPPEEIEGKKTKQNIADNKRYENTQIFKIALTNLAEKYGKIDAIRKGLSPDSIGSYREGTLKTDVSALYDLWNMISYMPNGNFLYQQGKQISTLKENQESFPHAREDVYADEDRFNDELNTAIAHPEALARSSSTINNLNELVESIIQNEVKQAKASGKIPPMPKASGKISPEKKQLIREQQKEIEGKINILKGEIYSKVLKAKTLTLDSLVNTRDKDAEGKIIKEKMEIKLPGLNLLDETALVAFIDEYVDMLGLSESGISRDPESPSFYMNPKLIVEEYQKISEMKGYESIPESIRKQYEENEKEIKTRKHESKEEFTRDDQSKFGKKIKEARFKIRENSYPEYVEIINKILTLPKELSEKLTKEMSIIPVQMERVIKDDLGKPKFFIINEQNEEEFVEVDYENKRFMRNGIPIDPDLVKYEKKDTEPTPVITGTVLANPKARQLIALLSLGFSMRDKSNANPSKIYSLMTNATDGGILRNNQTGGQGIFAESDARLRGDSETSPPFFIEFLKTCGAQIGNSPVENLYNPMDFMGIKDPRSNDQKVERSRKRIEKIPESPINNPTEETNMANSNNWYKIAKSVKTDKRYNHVVVTTKYDIRLLGRDAIANIDGQGKPNIPFISVLPFKSFGSLEKVAEFSSRLDNPYIAIAVSNEVEDVLKETGYWPN